MADDTGSKVSPEDVAALAAKAAAKEAKKAPDDDKATDVKATKAVRHTGLHR